MTIPKLLRSDLDRPLALKYFLYLFSVLFIFDFTYYGSYYIVLVFIIFMFEMGVSQFRELYIPDFFLWALVLLWGVFEISQSIVKSQATYYFYITVLLPFFIFVLFNNSKLSMKDLNTFFNILFITGILLSFFSFYISLVTNFGLRTRIPSTWDHYNLVAGYFMVLLMFNLSFIVNSNNRRIKLFYISSFLIILMGLFMTQTRGIWIATLFGMFYYIFRKPKLIMPIILVILVLFLLFYNVIMDRVWSVVNFGNDISTLGRFQAWYASILLIKENFLLGYGFDSFRYLRDSVITAYFVILPHSHNTYLTLILELGFIGFIFYISFFVKAFYYSFKMRKLSADPELHKFTDGLQLSFVGFTVAFMFEPYFTVLGTITYMLWILIAISYYLKNNFIDKQHTSLNLES